MADYIAPLQELIDQFRRLPSVGSKTAARYALALLKYNDEEVAAFADAILGAKRDVHSCEICHNISTDTLCPICQDDSRNKKIICVVEDPQDVMALERIRTSKWVYHVLGGVLNPRKQVTPDTLHISDLLERVKNDEVEEVIVATNSTFDGDATALYLNKLLSKIEGLKVTRLAYGIPVGGQLEYADEVTLDRAIQGRISFN